MPYDFQWRQQPKKRNKFVDILGMLIGLPLSAVPVVGGTLSQGVGLAASEIGQPRQQQWSLPSMPQRRSSYLDKFLYPL